MKGFFFGIIFTLLVLFIGGYYLLKSGRISFAADLEPSAMEEHLAMSAVDASTEHHAPDQKNPVPTDEADLIAGAQLYLNHCAGCHGLPSNPDSQFGRSFNPPVPAFFKDPPDMPENQNFYIIQHGVRWSGMPAWNKTLTDAQIWQLVTFLSNTQKLPPAVLKELTPAGSAVATPPPAPTAPTMQMH